MPQREADVIVIGAGIIGCAVAFELAEAGARVRIIDARTPGAGASQASAGVLAPYIEGHGSPLLRALGRRSLDLYPSFVDRVVAASSQPVEFDRIGTLEVVTSPDDRLRFDRAAGDLPGEGVETHWIDGARLAELEPNLAPHVVGGRQIPLHAVVHVPALTAALAAAAARRGVAFSTGTPASRLSQDGDAIAVHTLDDVFRARAVVMAAGTWAPGLARRAAAPCPYARCADSFYTLPPHRAPFAMWCGAPTSISFHGATAPSSLGATSEDVGFDERNTAAGVAGLLDAAIALVPALAGATFLEARRGLRPASADSLPFVGRSAVLPGLIYACGHYRNGALLAPLTAELVARLAAGDDGDDALQTLAPARAGRL